MNNYIIKIKKINQNKFEHSRREYFNRVCEKLHLSSAVQIIKPTPYPIDCINFSSSIVKDPRKIREKKCTASRKKYIYIFFSFVVHCPASYLVNVTENTYCRGLLCETSNAKKLAIIRGQPRGYRERMFFHEREMKFQ